MNNIKQSPITQVIEAPIMTYRKTKHTLFLAGGISNCPDWQSKLINKLSDYPDLTIFNPRRVNFPMNNPWESEIQIKWEFDHLKSATIIVVWFSSGSINPIVLYELGLWVNAKPEIPAFIGIDPKYERKDDVIIQTKLARPQINIVNSINMLSKQILKYTNTH